jgi:hypothetical protein
MERAYAKLPDEFEGFRRQRISPVGGQRHGVLRLEAFFGEKIGCMPEELTEEAWLKLPEEALAEAVNGEVFSDPAGLLSDQRSILKDMPEDIRRKRLAGHLLMMAQSGQYNYRRCLKHGETGAAQLAVCEFAGHTISAFFLLHHACAPYYKWRFRAMRALPRLSLTAELLEYLLTTDNEADTAEEKYNVMEGIAADITEELREQGLTGEPRDRRLTGAVGGDLEKYAYLVNDRIGDAQIRSMHVLATV